MTDVARLPRFDAVDLSDLPAPRIVEELAFEDILAAIVADFKERHPGFDMEMLETDPAIKIFQAAAYRELLLRARVNDAARAVMLAFAIGSDLDHLGALYATRRKAIVPGDPNASPPIPPTMESDKEYRSRVQLAPEALSTAGPIGAYRYHALSAHPDVRDVGVHAPSPGSVHVLPLVRTDDGIPGIEVLDAVRARLRSEGVRPLTDAVTVRAPERIDFQIDATLIVPHGPDSSAVQQAASKALATYLATRHSVGRPVYRSGILAALSVSPVETVQLVNPAADVDVAVDQVGWATDVSITVQIAE